MPFDPSRDNAPALLARAARAAGGRPDYTQGGGGNVSIKLNGERMLIKATGTRLRDLTASSGYALVNCGNIRRRILAGPGGEAEFSDYLCGQVLPVRGVPAAKPSVEAGFHSLLNAAVIHTHSVYANVLNMSAEGHDLGRRLFPGAEFLPYSAPGQRLCAAIGERARPGAPQVYFLANHGLVVSHAGIDGALELNGKVNETIRRGLSLPPFPALPHSGGGLSAANSERLAFYGAGFLLENVLSPDQALYCGPDQLRGADATPDVNEVLAALFYVLDCIRALKLTPKFLPREEVAYFGTMKSGRYSGGRPGVRIPG